MEPRAILAPSEGGLLDDAAAVGVGSTVSAVAARVIVLNGGSSAGKSSIARALQRLLAETWLVFGTDVLGEALPPAGGNAVITFGPAGEVWVAPGYRPLEQAWYRGIAAMAAAGVGLILDEVFLQSGDNQAVLAGALTGLDVIWVGVRCDAAVAAARESSRGDRVVGMAASQADVVHRGVTYDIEVDTTRISAADCARLIVDHLDHAVRADHADHADSAVPLPSGDIPAGGDVRVRFRVDDAALSALHGRAFGSDPAAVHPWARQLEHHSLTWIGAFTGDLLIGFVQLCWDGGSHAFLLDTVVDPDHQRHGIGGGLVRAAVAEARRAGCEWLHVDYEPHLDHFYRDDCGFSPTAAGLLHLHE